MQSSIPAHWHTLEAALIQGMLWERSSTLHCVSALKEFLEKWSLNTKGHLTKLSTCKCLTPVRSKHDPEIHTSVVADLKFSKNSLKIVALSVTFFWASATVNCWGKLRSCFYFIFFAIADTFSKLLWKGAFPHKAGQVCQWSSRSMQRKLNT